MTVAIPKFNDLVAPCFEAAHAFMLARTDSGRVLSCRVLQCGGCEGFGRIQLLREHRVDTLICSGIKEFYLDLLTAAGVIVVPGISDCIEDALADFLAGRLIATPTATRPALEEPEEIPLADLICWTHELFTAHGYRVSEGEKVAAFPIDLVAEIACPVCGKLVRVAICCGAHLYRPDQEIELFHLAAASNYNARVFVRTATPRIVERCRDYAIGLIDPDSRLYSRDRTVEGQLPLLQGTVPGHERASEGYRRNRT